jgi:hypothetical protein
MNSMRTLELIRSPLIAPLLLVDYLHEQINELVHSVRKGI